MDEVTAYIGLGSNLGDRHQHLQDAAAMIAALPGVRWIGLSRSLETRPVGPVQDQPDFVNAVARIETSLPALDLLDGLLAIEAQLGRVRRQRWGPRTIDLDILLYGDQTIDHPRLQVPHPEIPNRPFVQQGLAELRGSWPANPQPNAGSLYAAHG